MTRPLRAIAIAAALALALPATVAQAQMNFEGLGSKKKKSTKRTPTRRTRDPAPSNEKPEKPEKSEAEESEAPLPAGGLDLNKPAAPGPADKKAPPAPTMSFDAVDVSGKSADRQKLDVAVGQFKAQQYEQAASSAFELMQDSKLAALHLEAQYLLAKALYRLGMYHSSLHEFSKILAKGPNTKFFKTSLEWLFFISHKTTNETVILDEIAKYSNYEFPTKFRSEFHYLLARYHFVRGKALDEVEQRAEADKSFAEVKRLTAMIGAADPFYPRAKYLEGLAYFRDSKPEEALARMKEVIRVTRPGGAANKAAANKALRELAFMQLARTHYGANQNRQAIFYYGKVERGNTQWLEALFESSWASYRIGQYEQALGNLITLSSPFFRDEYFPEALILKAVIYYENCRYRESTTILEDFERIYGPVQEQLELITQKQMDSTEYYTILLDVQKKNKLALERNNTDLILERVLKLALTDKDLKKTNDSIIELEEEIDSYGKKGDTFRYSELTKSLLEGLKGQRETLIKKAGIQAKGKLEFELGELKKFRANGLRIKFETTAKEKEFLEEQLKQGGRTEVVKKYKYSVAVADDQLYWPYEGEYWRDELGTYQYTLTKGCIDRDSANQQRAPAGSKEL